MEYTENTAVGCVIMASGRAVRFGSDKLLSLIHISEPTRP